jgi:hypothetical protein
MQQVLRAVNGAARFWYINHVKQLIVTSCHEVDGCLTSEFPHSSALEWFTGILLLPQVGRSAHMCQRACFVASTVVNLHMLNVLSPAGTISKRTFSVQPSGARSDEQLLG